MIGALMPDTGQRADTAGLNTTPIKSALGFHRCEPKALIIGCRSLTIRWFPLKIPSPNLLHQIPNHGFSVRLTSNGLVSNRNTWSRMLLSVALSASQRKFGLFLKNSAILILSLICNSIFDPVLNIQQFPHQIAGQNNRFLQIFFQHKLFFYMRDENWTGA